MELSDRERFILHSTAVLTVDLLIKKLKHNPNELKFMNGMDEKQMFAMMEDIRKNRCRKLNSEYMIKLYDQMREEMMLGGALYKE
jgi:hypothetical protein